MELLSFDLEKLLYDSDSGGRDSNCRLHSIDGNPVAFLAGPMDCWADTYVTGKKERFMLVLSRHRDESIMIGDDVVITIVDIRGDKVRLGIEAPQDIPVHRQEVYEAIKRENQKAGHIQPEETRSLGNRHR